MRSECVARLLKQLVYPDIVHYVQETMSFTELKTERELMCETLPTKVSPEER